MTPDEAIKYLNQLRTLLQKIKIDAPKKVMQDYSKHAQTIATQAIYDFYLSYDPIRYKRTGNLLNLVEGVHTCLNDTTIIVEFSTGHMSDYKYDTAEYVGTGAFQYGIHGTSSVYVSTPTPRELFREKSYQFIHDMLNIEVHNYIEKLI